VTAALPFVLDSGALIALERSDERMTNLLKRTRAEQARLILPASVLAQTWRGGHGRQALVAALVNLDPERCLIAIVDSAAAKRIGLKIGESGHADVVDVHVALLAREHRAVVVTSDRDDLLRVDPGLKEFIVDV
jgi:hypothetical protein